MRKNFKLALVPLALAGAFASNSALAGSEACLEIYTGDSSNVGQYTDENGVVQTGFGTTIFNGVTGFDAEYQGSFCVADNLRGGATQTNLQPLAPLKVAQEFTRNKSIDLFDIDSIPGATVSSVNVASPANFSKNVVYVPTSPLPGGTRITFRLHNATYDESQLHLLALNDENLDNSEPGILAVAATTDGVPTVNVAGTQDFDFIVPSGLTIPAGTRLAMSNSTTNVIPPNIQFDNDDCSVNPVVDISVPSAINVIGGGQSIEGGETIGTDTLVQTSRQFSLFNSHTTAEGVVDALAPSLRTQFVVDINNGQLDGASATQVYLQSNFLDSLDVVGGLEVGITETALDHVEITPVGLPQVANNVDLQVFDVAFENGASGDTFSTNILWNDGTVSSSIFADIDSSSNPTPTTYNLDADELFAQNADFSSTLGNPVYFSLTQRDTDLVIEPSRFFVDFTYTLDFNDSDLLDHCVTDLRAYEINTNGSVLKVPYHFEAGGNWIRVTNEFNQEAVISMDIQGEVGTTAAPNSYVVGVVLDQVVPPNGSVLLYVDDLVAQAEAKGGYVSGGDVASGENQRHTITLVVSAPSDQVHGVAVQKVDGNDRVVPVLDLNNWQQ